MYTLPLLLIITIFFFPHPAVIIDSSIPQSGFKWAGPRLQGFLRLYFQPHTTSHIVFIASIVEGFFAFRHMSYFEIAFMFLCYTHDLSVNTYFKSNIQFIPSTIFNQQESMKFGARFGRVWEQFGRGRIHFLVPVSTDSPLGWGNLLVFPSSTLHHYFQIESMIGRSPFYSFYYLLLSPTQF